MHISDDSDFELDVARINKPQDSNTREKRQLSGQSIG